MKQDLSKFSQISTLLVVWVLLFASISTAEPTSVASAPVVSSLKDAIQSLFSEQTLIEPVEEDDSLFRVELGSLEYLDSKETSLNTEEFKSKKVLVYFWSVYCRGCIGPAKELENIRAALKDSDIEVVTVHLFESDKALLLNRLAQLSLGLPVLFGPNEIRDMFSVKVLPTAVAFDDKHRVIARFDGNFDVDGISVKLTKQVELEVEETGNVPETTAKTK